MMKFIKSISVFLLTLTQSLAGEDFAKMALGMAKKFDTPIIKAAKAKEMINKKEAIILDAREKHEYEISHIKDAIYVGFEDFKLEETLKKIPKDKTVIVYCSVGYRSGKIGEKLKNKGIKTFNLYGGIFNWHNQSLPIFTGKDKPTQKIHGFNKDWSKWINKKADVTY